MDQQDILARLDRMDMEAFATLDNDNLYRIVIVGGSGLVLLNTITRATQDIDVIDAPAEVRHLLDKYDANLRVSTYINNFPYNYEDRIRPLPVGGRKIRFFTASLEDIVIAKLYSFRDSDRMDLVSDNVLQNIDWDRLRHLALDETEAMASALNDRSYRDFLYNYHEYVGRYGPHEKTDV